MPSKSKKLPTSLEPVPGSASVAATATAQPPAVPSTEAPQAQVPAPAPAPATAPVTAVAQASSATPPAVASTPDPVSKALSKKKPTTIDPKSSKKYVDVGAGYQIAANEGSGYYILLKAMAKKGHFAEVVAALETVNPSDKAQAQAILSKALVERETLEEAVRQDPTWDEHAQSRIKNLKMRAKSDIKAAESTLANKDRVKGNKWLGNIREMLGVCISSYPKSKNRNTKKFEDAGVVFRQFPILVLDGNGKAVKPKRSDKVYYMMFPAKYINTVRSCVETVYGVKEPRK